MEKDDAIDIWDEDGYFCLKMERKLWKKILDILRGPLDKSFKEFWEYDTAKEQFSDYEIFRRELVKKLQEHLSIREKT